MDNNEWRIEHSYGRIELRREGMLVVIAGGPDIAAIEEVKDAVAAVPPWWSRKARDAQGWPDAHIKPIPWTREGQS